MATCPRMNFIRGSCSGVVAQGELIRKKCTESKSSGGNFPGGNFVGTSCPGRNSGE